MPVGFFLISFPVVRPYILLQVAMRVPLFIAIPVCLLTIVLIWWSSTRDMDFLTPPTEAQLEQIRRETLASLPVSSMQQDAISIRVPVPETNPVLPDPVKIQEPVDLGDLSVPPMIDTYSDRAPEGADKLLGLSVALEKAGSFQRALLANERVLDLAQSDPQEIQAAIANIQELRPTLPAWNNQPENAFPITVHIGTGQKFSKLLPDILESMVHDLSLSSSGLISFSYKLNIGKSIQTIDAPTPVALWITGLGNNSPSTDVLSFTTDDAETLRNDLLKTVFNLIRGHLTKSTAYNPAPEALEDPVPALNSHITRLLWQEFAMSLNPKSEE